MPPTKNLKKGVGRVLGLLLILPVTVYVFYVVGVAAFLNTPLFAHLTRMKDKDSTHLRFSMAYSFIPGKVHVGKVLFALREPGVDIDVHLGDSEIELDLEALIRKELRIHRLDTSRMHVGVRSKKAPPTKPEDKKEISLEEEKHRQANRWKLWITGIDLRGFESIDFNRQKLEGEIRIQGGFFLQPGTIAEIFPVSLTVREGRWNGDIEKINLDLLASFDRFAGPRTDGSKIFDYFDAKLSGSGVAQSLDLLNLTLRTLEGYTFGRTQATNLRTEIVVKKGVIQPGSHFRAEKTEVRFDSPTFDFVGTGDAVWEVGNKPNESELRVRLADAKTDIRLSDKQTLKGSIARVSADARLRGLTLADPFSGLAGKLAIRDGKVSVGIDRPVKGAAVSSDAEFALAARIRGELTAVAGKIESSWIPRGRSSLKIWIDRSRIAIPDLGKIQGNGLIAISVKPIDFRTFEAEFPSLQFDYSGKIEDRYSFDFRWRSSRSIRRFPGSGKRPGNFEGQGLLEISKVDEILKFLSDTDKIPKLAAVALGASEMRAAIEWDFTEAEKWLRTKEVDSNGIWKGWGSVIFSDQETRGAFEGRVAGIPIGIGLGGPNVRFKLLPNQTWYDARAPLDPDAAP